jgi:mRNA-degrading endonuclease RelE of RelBE toxin-antitoxin system
VKSVRTKKFKELFAKLPEDVQKQAKEAYRIFEDDPFHPGLNFECINKKKSWWSARVNDKYRAVGIRKGDTIVWFFIGTHTRYDRFL